MLSRDFAGVLTVYGCALSIVMEQRAQAEVLCFAAMLAARAAVAAALRHWLHNGSAYG
jgi:hypothetical protein